MKIMRREIRWITALLAAVCILTGCGGPELTEAGTTAGSGYTASAAAGSAEDQKAVDQADAYSSDDPEEFPEEADGGNSITSAAGQDSTSMAGNAFTETVHPAVREDGVYFSKDEVAFYIYTYGHLPQNYITKKEARALGWEGGPLEPYAPGKAIGGDYYGNYEGTLPDGPTYHECDIDTEGTGRGAKRIVYSDDGKIYYTDDHYETFTLLYENGANR